MPPNEPILTSPADGAVLNRGQLQRFVYQYDEEETGGGGGGSEYGDLSGAISIPASMSVAVIVSTINGGSAGDHFVFEPRVQPINLGANALLPPANSTLTTRYSPLTTNVTHSSIGLPGRVYETVQGPVNALTPSVILQGNANNTNGAIIDTQNRADIIVRGLGVGGARHSSLPTGSYANRARGIKGSNTLTTLRDCLIFNNENQGVGQGYILADHCHFQDNGLALTTASGGGDFFTGAWGGIKTTRGFEAHHCYMADIRGNALWLDCTGEYLIAYDNVIEYASEWGVHYETSWALAPTADNGEVYRNFIRRTGYKRDNTIYPGLEGHKGSAFGAISSKHMHFHENHAEFSEHANYISEERNLTIIATRQATGTCANGMPNPPQGYANQNIRFENNSSMVGTAPRSEDYDTLFSGTTNAGNTVGTTGSGAGSGGEGGGDPDPDPDAPSSAILVGGGDAVPGRLGGWDDAPVPSGPTSQFQFGGKSLGPSYRLGNLMKAQRDLADAAGVPFFFFYNGDLGYNVADEGVFAERVQPMFNDLKDRLLPTPGNHERLLGGEGFYYRGYRPWVYHEKQPFATGTTVSGSNMTYTRNNGQNVSSRTNPIGPAIPHREKLRQTEGVHNWDGQNFTINHDNTESLHGFWYDYDIDAETGADTGWVVFGLASNAADGCEPGDAQYHWFKERLEAPEYADKKFFVQWHYDVMDEGTLSATNGNGKRLYELCFDNQVDIVTNGHVHRYCRYKRLSKTGTANVNGPYVITLGSMGNDRALDSGPGTVREANINAFIYGKFELSQEGFKFWAYDDSGTLRDQLLGAGGGWVPCLR